MLPICRTVIASSTAAAVGHQWSHLRANMQFMQSQPSRQRLVVRFDRIRGKSSCLVMDAVLRGPMGDKMVDISMRWAPERTSGQNCDV